MSVRRYTSWEHSPEVLPYLGEYRFYRDEGKGGTLVIVGDDGAPHYLVNPLEVPDRDYGRDELFSFQFGSSGTTFLLVWARSFEDGLEEAGGWLADHAPGHLTDLKEEYEDALKEAKEELGEDADEDDLNTRAQEIAETDMTYTDSGGYIPSWEWWGSEAQDGIRAAAEYASRALYAAKYLSFDLRLEDGTVFELSSEALLEMFSEVDLALTVGDVEALTKLEPEQMLHLKAFSIERVS